MHKPILARLLRSCKQAHLPIDTYAPERWPHLLGQLHLPEAGLDTPGGAHVADFVGRAAASAAVAAAAAPAATALVAALERLLAVAAGVPEGREIAAKLASDEPMAALAAAAAAATAAADALSAEAAAAAAAPAASAGPRWLPAALGPSGAAETFARLSGGLLGLLATMQLLVSGCGDFGGAGGAVTAVDSRKEPLAPMVTPRRELSFSGGLNQLRGGDTFPRGDSPEASPAGVGLASIGTPGAETLLSTLAACQAALVSGPAIGSRLEATKWAGSEMMSEKGVAGIVDRLQEKALLATLTVRFPCDLSLACKVVG
jgi:hypothetical protein